MNDMKWQDFEHDIRKLAEAVWGGNAIPEVEAGVKCDLILKYKDGYWILVEISKQDSLAKLREDLAKFALLRPALLLRGIYAECYFVTLGDHTSLIESGKAVNVEVHSPVTFANKFLGSSAYVRERERHPFGSAVNPDSGDKDEARYTATYYLDDEGNTYTLQNICELLQDGKKIILVGEFGTGKSRCLMEAFNILTGAIHPFSAIAINLRDNWGYKRLSHIIRNHLEMLGLGEFSDSLVRSLVRGNHTLLLDGIDEIGSQSWSGDPARLTEIRKISLEGVRDIISSCGSSGILLTGREHYFSSDKEMVECLGLSKGGFLKLRCPDEFSDEEIAEYVKQNTKLTRIPEWVPRKPLVCQLLARLAPHEVQQLEEAAHGEVEFFETIFDAICERETRINPAIYKDILKGILLHLAQQTRALPATKEQISTAEINTAFYKVAGYAPIDESAILLQRLPYLGRVGSGGAERIFVDAYARDGLRGISFSEILLVGDRSVATKKWIQPVGKFGIRVVSSKVTPNDTANKFVKYCINHGNVQIGCDYIQLCLSIGSDYVDYRGISVDGGTFDELSFVDSRIKNLSISSSYIEKVEIDNAFFESVQVSNCAINNVIGIGSVDKLPDVFHTCTFENFKGAFTISRISELNIPNGQKTLLSIIKKLFFQPGAGRQKEALLRGAENYWDQGKAKEILRYMLRNNIIIESPGDHGVLYIPKRSHTLRMGKIWELQSNSNDELWDISA